MIRRTVLKGIGAVAALPALSPLRGLAAEPLRIGVIGAGWLGGVRLKDSPGFPAAYLAEATTLSNLLDLYRASKGLNWTMLAPAPAIAPGERTGRYRVRTDSPAGDSISAEDFAVAIFDELERPAHAGTRFTVAN